MINEARAEVNGNKILLYYNAHSGNGIFKNSLDHIIERCQDAGYQVVPVRATKGLVIDDVLSKIDQSEYSRIIIAGGDGTINLCVNAMVRHDIRLPIALLPAGTANDFAYYFELPSDMDMLLDVALGSKTTRADVGIVNNKVFVYVSAIGALIVVSQKTHPNLKNAIGVLAYYLKALTEIPQIRALPVTLTTPEQVYEEEIYFMVVMNGESAGGFRKLSRQSSMNDGKLDVIAFKKMPMKDMGKLLFDVVHGRHPDNKNVLCFQTEKLTIESPVDINTDIDGEHGEKLPLNFSVLHKRLEVLVSDRTWHYAEFDHKKEEQYD